MNITAELRNAVMDNFTIDKRLVSDAADAIEMLGEENGKLRSLVRGLHTNLSDLQRAICNSDDMWGYAKYYEECLISARKLMRELGIEVEV